MSEKYNVQEPEPGTPVWCNTGFEAWDHDRIIALDALDLDKWVFRKYQKDFYVECDRGLTEWFRFICDARLFVKTDLRLSLKRSYKMSDAEYQRRFADEFEQFRKTFQL